MMTKRLVCIICPRGCELTAEISGCEITQVSGHKCKRGAEYAAVEIFNPARILTTCVYLPGRERMLAVRSDLPVPKEALFEALKKAKTAQITAPVQAGEILIKGFWGEANLIASESVE